MDYAYDSIRRFIEVACSRPYERPDDEAIQTAGAPLSLLVHDVHKGVDPKKRFTELGIRKVNKRRHGFRPSEATVGSPAFKIVAAMVRKQNNMSQEQAVKLLQEQVANADPSTVRRWIKEIEPRVRRTLATLHKLDTKAREK